MDAYRRFQRKKEKERLAQDRRERQEREQEELRRRANARLLGLSQASHSGDENDTPPKHDNSPKHIEPTARRTQENSMPLARPAEKLFSSTAHTSAKQAESSHSQVSQVSWSSPNSSKARAKRRLADDSSSEDDDDDFDLLAFSSVAQPKKPVASSLAHPQKPAAIKSPSIPSPPSRTSQVHIDSSLTSEPVHKRKSPRNPHTMSLAVQSPVQAVPFQLTNKNNDDDLWSDMDNEEEPINKSKAERDAKSLKKKPKKSRAYVEYDRDPSDPLSKKSRLEDDEDAEIDPTEEKPFFDNPKFGPLEFEPFVLNPGNLGIESPICVPATISRYLPLYQKEGIKFLYDRAITSEHGAVLGDDMGLGKTVQVIGLLSALLKKKGDGSDLLELIRREKEARKNLIALQNFTDNALNEGIIPTTDSTQEHLLRQQALPKWAPILIIAPNSVLKNWINDFATWGHFSVVEYRGENKERALEKIQVGSAEILLMGQSVMNYEEAAKPIIEPKGDVRWKLIVVDEFHQFKNFKATMSKNLRNLRNAHTRNLIGLTGTLMQNEHSELWNLVDIVYKDFLGTRKEFGRKFGKPIKYAMARKSTPSARKLSEEKQVELSNKMQTLYKRRLKDHILKDLLPMKDERVVFCEPSDLQIALYKRLIKLPDFDYLRKANLPCDCGVNERFFREYRRLTTIEEKLAFQRKHRDEIIPRTKCCFSVPTPEDLPKAVIWRQNHDRDQPCEKCPYCICLPALTVLNKLSSHVSLLQAEVPLDQINEQIDPKPYKDAKKAMDLAELCIPDDLLHELPGASRIKRNGLMNDHFKLSGKMRVLKKLLEAIYSQGGRVLLFSSSTQMLDLIEDFLNSEARYCHLRMDGSTDTTSRNATVDKFKSDPNQFLFLLSTKAMGLGLNLTEASFVIIFDVEWNPAWDSQAQDRAYRIGQQKNVKVFRLITRGTIEELKYLRQVYKQQLTNATIPDIQSDPGSARLFDGVAKDKYRRGELFGIANLLKFEERTFMNYATKIDNKEAKKYEKLKNDIRSLEDVQSTLMIRSEEAESLLQEEVNVFRSLATKRACADHSAESVDESDDEGILGGESQLLLDISNEIGDDSNDESGSHETNSTQEIDDDSVSLVDAPIAETRVASDAKSATSNEKESTRDDELSVSNKSNRKRKVAATIIDMRSSGNFSIVGLSVQNLLQDSSRTSFGMSDFAIPNSRGDSKRT